MYIRGTERYPSDSLMHYLFFDTETTGLPRNSKAPASDLRNWPRMVQVAWLVTDNAGRELRGEEHVITPTGFTIPSEAAKIHGITTELALRTGVPLAPVLESLRKDVIGASLLIAHNIAFDEKIVGAEFIRTGLANPIESKPRKCTMLSSTKYCAIPGNYGHKWPKLQELYVKLFGESFEGAHSALADVRACVRCYFKLQQLGII